MSARKEQGGGSGGERRRGPGGDFEEEETHVVEPSRQQALVPQRRVRLFDRAVYGELPAGMASNEQLDAFRELRTRLQLMATAAGRSHFKTLVVPITAGAGASFVARNLAAAFTLQEDSVAVLIDCDFRNPSQHGVLNSHPDGEGLSEYLDYWAHTATDPLVLVKRLLLPTGIPRLHLIPAGRCEAVKAGRPREYFSSGAMRTVIQQLSEEPCFVFLDGPPITGSPDARILSDLADFVILVVGYGRSTAAAITQAAAIFERPKLAGVVFNECVASPAAR